MERSATPLQPPRRPVRRALVLMGATLALALVARLDGAWGDRLPIELLYLPALVAIAWHGPMTVALAAALLAASLPELAHHASLPGARDLAPDVVLLRAAAFVVTVVFAIHAHRRWRGLQEESHEDSLTGLLHHGAFADAVRRELLRQQRDAQPLSVLCLDVDGFKRLNDTRGHAFGDRVLVQLADELRANVRASDVLARTGGDEFAALLPGAGPAAAAVVREHLRAVLQTWAKRERLPIGVSLGIATSEPGRPTTAAALLERADQDMYREKHAHHAETGTYARTAWPAPGTPRQT